MLKIDCKREEEHIINFIKKSLLDLGRSGAVIGLSGGLDSSTCAYLLKKALGRNKVLALILPERDSSPINMDHARLVAKTLGLKTIEFNLTPVLDQLGVYKVGPAKSHAPFESKGWKVIIKLLGPVLSDTHSMMFGGKFMNKSFSRLTKLIKYFYGKTAFSVAKIRLRMLILSFQALSHNYAVIGTTDKSEFLTGHYDVHGDGANDITLLRHLYKTQIRQLAEYVGVPSEIISKPSSGDLFGNLPNEIAFGVSYEQLDRLLDALERKRPDKELARIMPLKFVNDFKKSIEIAKLSRKLPLALD